MAKDASIEIIRSVKPHPNADRLDISEVLGFECVTQKGFYKGGEKIVFIQPDAVLPEQPWAEDYRKYSPKRIKAVKLRDVWSRGIICPLDILPVDFSNREIGEDVAVELGVTHYEAPIPQQLDAKTSTLPLGIPATDEEKWSNLIDKIEFGQIVDGTLKIDGQSSSYYYDLETDAFGVLSRKMEMKPECINNYTVHVEKYDIENKLRAYCKKYEISMCIRGESFGSGIQGSSLNPHSKLHRGWKMFSVWLISERRYTYKGEKFYFKNVAEEMGLPHVDFIEENVVLTTELIKHYENLDKINGERFEGIVFNGPKGTFKVMNNYYDSMK